VLSQDAVDVKPGSYVKTSPWPYNLEMSITSGPAEGEFMGNSIVFPSNVSVAVRVLSVMLSSFIPQAEVLGKNIYYTET
jgi:hypothetical protein